MNDDEWVGESGRVARENCVLLTRVGSTVHGVTVDDQDDRDELGICVEPPDYVIGLRRFEQHEWRTQPTGVRSGPGDVDRTVYGLRKWLRLALAGNPSVLVPLFVPVTDVVYAAPLGVDLRLDPSWILSRQAGHRFLGYLRSQRAKLLGERGGLTNRPELVERYGFDTKFAYHMIRLGLQGRELMRTGRLTLPLPEPDRTWLRELRVGGHSQDDALAVANYLEVKLELLLDPASSSPLPERPNLDLANAWLVDAHRSVWRMSDDEDRGSVIVSE